MPKLGLLKNIVSRKAYSILYRGARYGEELGMLGPRET